MPSNRPAVSRDTRLLLTIVLVAVATLWVLARIRFPDRPPTPNPVPPVLAQIAPPSALDDVASTVAQLESQLQPLIVPVDLHADLEHEKGASGPTLPALRFRADLALVLMPARPSLDAAPASHPIDRFGWDPASRLAIVRIGGEGPSALPMWVPRRLALPRFLIVGSVFEGAVSLRPVFVSSLVETTSAIWSGPIWMLPPAVEIPAGGLVFNIDGTWAGLAADVGGRRAIVPAGRVLSVANRLVADGQRPHGSIGVDVQRLTPALMAATGASAGVIVTWVDAQGPAAGLLAAGESIDAVDGERVSSVDDWIARISRLPADGSVVLRVRRGEAVRDVPLTARAVGAVRTDPPLGLELRTLPKHGASVLRVDPQSAAAAAGLQSGDLLTLVGDVSAPTAAQALRAFAAAPRDRPILVGITRGDAHRVVAIKRTW